MMRHRLFAIAALGICSIAACGDDSSSGGGTTGQRIVLHTTATEIAGAKGTLVTSFGWDVTLSKAAVAASGFYYFDGPPPTAMWKKTPTWRERFSGVFIGTAHAHPGHYQAGTSLGEVILPAPTTLDLFASPIATLPDGNAITGTYRSARFVIAQTAPADAVLGGHIAIAEGKAVKHDGTSTQPYYFRLIADYADVSASIQNGAVDGCVLDETVVSDSGSVSVQIDPTVWLNLVDFSKIALGTEAAPTETKNAGFSQGVTQLSAYHFTYTK